MAYIQATFEFSDCNDINITYKGNYGAKGERRQPRKKATSEQIEKQNQRNRENRVRRLINQNFTNEDYWVTLKYPAGTKKTVKEMKADFTKFTRKMRYRYQKAAVDFKYIYRMEVGKNGGLHIHLLCNRIEETDLFIQKCWQGHAWITTLYEEGGYQKLAEYGIKRYAVCDLPSAHHKRYGTLDNYIVKKPDDAIKGQLSLFPEEDREDLIHYGTSRNMEKPVPIVKEYSRRTVRAIKEKIESGYYMDLATPGFYIDKNTIQTGVNPFTGESYIHYLEYRIRRE